MSNAASLTPAFSPIDLRSRPLTWQIGAVVLGTLFLTLSSYIEVPMVPVPVTMQTFAVAMVGALYGWRLGAITIIAWLAEAAVGLPVLSGGSAGAHHFVGPTAGYLFAFPVMGAMIGWLAERGWNARQPVLAFVSMLLGNALCLALGGAWLATLFGAEVAWTSGVAPFIVGGVLKSALGAALLALLVRGKARSAA